MKQGFTPFRLAVLALGFGFLYGPIALLVIYSFNASRLVTVWGGFSTRWYAQLFQDAQMLTSARTSLEVAITAGALATMMGTLAALALARFGPFRSRTLFAALVYAPLVIPEVITGLSLLLLFVALDVDRGFVTVVLGHATIGTCFVAVIVHSRLVALDPALEEAAADLGAPPGATFLRVTLPLALPAIVAGFLLSVTLSLDDLVIASFTSGPGSTTLPMRIYSQVRLGVTPEVNAISTLLIAAVAVLLLAGTAISGRRGVHPA